MLKLIPKIIVLLCILVLVSPIEVYSSDVELTTNKGKATTAKKTSTKATTTKKTSTGAKKGSSTKTTKSTKTKTKTTTKKDGSKNKGKTSTTGTKTPPKPPPVKCDFESIMGKKVTWKDKCNNKKLMAACGEK